ncbi:unnamed protein product [Boreogadus saida]
MHDGTGVCSAPAHNSPRRPTRAADGDRKVKERLEAQPAVWGTLVHEGGGEEEEAEEEEQDEEEEEEEKNKEEEEEEDDEDEEEEEEDEEEVEEEERVGSCSCQNHVRVRNGSDRKGAVGRERFAQLSSEVAFPLPTVPLVVGRMSIAAAATNPDFPATHLASIYGELISGEC